MLACRGMPLDKDGEGGVRPIAVGELIWNVIAKSLHTLYARADCLLPWQFGVKSPGGVEPVVRAVEMTVEGKVQKKYDCQLDMTNTYNTASRVDVSKVGKKYCPQLWRPARWAYGTPTDVAFFGADGEVEFVQSSSGVCQGDPLAPFFFSLAHATPSPPSRTTSPPSIPTHLLPSPRLPRRHCHPHHRSSHHGPCRHLPLLSPLLPLPQSRQVDDRRRRGHPPDRQHSEFSAWQGTRITSSLSQKRPGEGDGRRPDAADGKGKKVFLSTSADAVV
jgi:hypothetical protein